MCAKYYDMYMCKKIAFHQSWARLLDTASKLALFSVSGSKDEKLMKEANLHHEN